MNVVIQQLSRKQNLQDFLLALLDNVQKYFKSSAPMTEDKAYATVTTIFTRIARDFPLISSIQNIAKRLSNDLRDRINDKCENMKEKKKGSGLKSFMEGIKDENETLVKGNSQQSQQNKNAWIKKMLLESISELKQDIKQADQLTFDILRLKLERIAVPARESPIIVFIDSFLTNQKLISGIQGYQLKKVVTSTAEPKANQILLAEAAAVLKQARLLVISADAVLRNGGILSKSGSLMLAIIAHQLNIPVLAVSRSYCLTEQIFFNQQSLVHEQSSKGLFEAENQHTFRVQISKRYDYVEPRLVGGLVGESRGWQGQSIIEIFEEYYQ